MLKIKKREKFPVKKFKKKSCLQDWRLSIARISFIEISRELLRLMVAKKMVKTFKKISHFTVRNLLKWKLFIARISFTGISSELCHPVFLETVSSEAVVVK